MEFIEKNTVVLLKDLDSFVCYWVIKNRDQIYLVYT